MQLANDLIVFKPIHRSTWKQGLSGGQTPVEFAPIVHIMADSASLVQIKAGLLNQSVEVTDHVALRNIGCRVDPHQPSCAVIDIDLHAADVGSVMGTLAGKDNPPVILIGRCDDARVPVRAMKLGAFDFFSKPFDVQELVRAILSAMDQDRRQSRRRQDEQVLRDRIATLTRREREVLPLVVGGLLNKQAASLLGISEITLQIHRGQIMRKMQADSLADLVRMCVKLRIRHWRPAA